MHYITKISSNGRIVLPAEVREQLNLHDGDRLIIDVKNNVIHLSTFRSRIQDIQEEVREKTDGKNLITELKKLRKEDETGE